MTIKLTKNDSEMVVALTGRLDTTTAPSLEQSLNENTGEVKSLVFDMSALEYISSAGLRVLLAAQKRMQKQGSMKLTGVSEEVMEVFEMTGFADILTIE